MFLCPRLEVTMQTISSRTTVLEVFFVQCSSNFPEIVLNEELPYVAGQNEFQKTFWDISKPDEMWMVYIDIEWAYPLAVGRGCVA